MSPAILPGPILRQDRTTLRIAVALYPLGAGAAAVNLFFLSLIGHSVGLAVMTPVEAVIGGAVIGAPASFVFARHIRRLMRQAETDLGDQADAQEQTS